MKKRNKVLMGVAAAVCMSAAAVFGYAGNYFYDFALNPRSGHTAEEKMAARTEVRQLTQAEQEAKKERKTANKWLREHAEADYMESRDGLKLHAYRIAGEGHRYVVICHGYKNKGSYMGLYAKKFYEMGYQIVAPDARGHGESEGDYIGMGWPDRLDLVDWCVRIAREDPRAEIVLFGVSMGGAAVLMAAGEDLPSQVKAVVEDCGYTSVWDEFKVQLSEMFDMGTFPVLPAADLVTRLRAGYGLKEASALKQVKKSRLPILFIHGKADTFVPFAMMEELYQAAPGVKEKLAVAGAPHGGSAQTEPEKYWDTIGRFVGKYVEID